MRGTVVSVAKRDLKAGEMLDGEGGYTVWGKAQPVRRAGNALPIGLAHGVSVTRDLAKGDVLTLDDVDIQPDDVLKMYRGLLDQSAGV